MSETVCDIANQHLYRRHAPPHRLEAMASANDEQEGEREHEFHPGLEPARAAEHDPESPPELEPAWATSPARATAPARAPQPERASASPITDDVSPLSALRQAPGPPRAESPERASPRDVSEPPSPAVARCLPGPVSQDVTSPGL